MCWRVSLTVSLGVICLTCGCAAPRAPRELTNPDLLGKIPAIKDSVDRRDMAAVRHMVKDLESDDPAVRFYAIQGLQRLTGETFGYQYYRDEDARRPALAEWQAWLRGWEAALQAR
jgi:hypothetical protein